MFTSCWNGALRRVLAGLALGAGLLAAAHSPAQDRMERLPEELEGVTVTERLNQQLPGDVMFTNDRGQVIRFGDLFPGDKPAIVFIGYYGCPMLCGMVLNATMEAMMDPRMSRLVAGRDFRFIALSIDPSEDAVLAAGKKETLLELYNRREVNANEWHFLTGKEPAIRTVTEAFGFGYRWIPAQQEYSHAAVIHVVTPDGRISRYLYGVKYDPETLRLSLVEAGQGRIGSTLDQILLFCFHFDPKTGKYSLAALNLMKLAGFATVLALVVGIGLALIKERRARAREALGLGESVTT